MFRAGLFFGCLLVSAGCGAPLRQVPVALDPANPEAPESALPQRVAVSELPPLERDKNLPQAPAAPPMDDMPAGHHMHHQHDMTPKPAPPAGASKPMDHTQHGGAGAGQ